MLVWLCFLVVFGQAAFAVLAIRQYVALPHVPSLPRRSGLPRVSIIVPARNEASNLGRLLPSLLALDYGSYEIIVVDDGSTDATAAVAGEFDVIIVRAAPPPPGWTGKNYACHLGATIATGDWLLFTDADTEHAPRSLASILGYALDRRLDAVSVLAGQDCFTFWERLLIPFAYQQYFVGVPGTQVNQPRHPSALANGQYMLFRRDAYERIGGHRRVRDSVIEDVRLAYAMKTDGLQMGVARAEHLVHVRMYRDLSSVWSGFSKNAFQFVALDPRRGALVVLSTIVAGMTPTLLALGLRPGGDTIMLLAGYSYAFMALGLAGWDRLFSVPPWYGLLQPLSVGVFALIAIDSAIRTLTGRGVTWKGRTYRSRIPSAESVHDETPSRQRPP